MYEYDKGRFFGSKYTVLGLAVFATLYLIANLVQVIFHEGGHLVFGLLTGYKFSSFRILNIMLVKTDNGIKLKRYSIPGTRGQCLMLPPDLKDGEMPYILYNMGGFLMNIIVSVIGLIIFRFTPYVVILSEFLLLFCLIGFFMAFSNAAPFMSSLLSNDGQNLISLSESPEAMRSFWISLKMAVLLVDGMSIKDMPEEWFVLPLDEAMKNKIVADIGGLACDKLIAEHRFKEADELAYRMLNNGSNLTPRAMAMFVNERMYIAAVTDGRASVVDSMKPDGLTRAFKEIQNDCSVLRSRYAYAVLCKRDEKTAAQIRKKFNAVIAKYPYEGIAQTEKGLIDIVDGLKNSEK